MTNAVEQHGEWRAEEDDVIEAVVEVGLVLGSPGDHDMVMGPQEVGHLVCVPRAAVHWRTSAPPQLRGAGCLDRAARNGCR